MRLGALGSLAGLLGLLAVIGAIGGASLAAALTPAAGDVLHLVVEMRWSDSLVSPRVAEYWLDEQRFLAKVGESTANGQVTTATGRNWMLHVPAHGAAFHLETADGAGPTRSVFASLYYMRDAYKAGAAKLTAGTADTLVVQLGARTTAFEQASGLPLWETMGTTRVDYVYRVRERLPAAAVPAEFISDTAGRDIAYTVETTPAEAAARVHFQLLSAGPVLLGRPLEKTVLSYGANSLTLEQVGQMYGSDIQLSMSLLGQDPTSMRPGGESVLTAIGVGRLYSEAGGRVQLLLLGGRVATSIFAPDRQIAFNVARLLRPAR